MVDGNGNITTCPVSDDSLQLAAFSIIPSVSSKKPTLKPAYDEMKFGKQQAQRQHFG